MIRRDGAEFRGQCCAAGIRQLIGVHSKLQTSSLCRAQNPAGGVQIEITALAKDVAVLREVLPNDFRNHLLDHTIGVLRRSSTKLFGNGVRTEKRRHELDRRCLVQTANYAQNFQLVFQRESITGLCFHGGSARPQKPLRAPLRLIEKLIFASRACLADRRTNTAALGSDLLVSRPARSHLKLINAISAKNRMRVRINESRENDASARIDDLGIVRQVASDLARSAGGNDLSVAHQHSTVLNDGKLAQLSPNPSLFWTGQSYQL